MSVSVSLPQINKPIHTKDGYCDPDWYRFFETLQNRTGGTNDLVAASASTANAAHALASTAKNGLSDTIVNLQDRASKETVINAGAGLEGGGDLSGDSTLSVIQDTGWTPGTGTSNKGAFAAYGGATMSGGYVQAEAQATNDAVKAASQRILAIEQALLHNENITP